MTSGAGVVRSVGSLAAAGAVVAETADLIESAVRQGAQPVTPALGELANLATVASALLVSAGEREESRGAHARAEFPEPVASWRCRLVHGPVR